MRLSHKLFTIACLASVSFAVPGFAQEEEAPAAVQAWLDTIERQSKAEVDYDSVEEDGQGNITITGLSISKAAEGEQPGFTMTVGETVMSGIRAGDGALYTVGRATFANTSLNITGRDTAISLSIPESSAEDWYIRELGENATPEETILSASAFARKTVLGKMTITANGQPVTADGLEMTWDGGPNSVAGTAEVTASNILIPEALVAMMDPSGMLKQLGYTSLSFDLTGGGTSARSGDNINYDFNFGIAGRDMAAIKIGISAGDIPMAVFAELQKAQTVGTEPDFNALMPQILNISFNGASFRFEDASLTKKLLPMLAAMQGMDEKALAASIGPMMQMGLMQLQNEAFAAQAVAAVNAFLAEPKSITLTAKPAAPVKVSEFMAMNPSAPGEAIVKLGVSVSAND